MGRRNRNKLRVRVEALEQRVVLGFADILGGEAPPPTLPPFCPPPKIGGPGAPGLGGGGPGASGPWGGAPGASSSTKPVRHSDGVPVVYSTDIQANAFDLGWGHTRSWSGLNNSGPNGNGWVVSEMPYLTVAGGAQVGGTPGLSMGSGALTGTEQDERITIVAGGTSTYTFMIPTSAPYLSYSYIGADKLFLELTADPTPALRFTDSNGNVTEFYDVRRDGNGKPVFGSMAEDLPQKYGKFKSYTPAGGGARVEASYDSGGALTAITIKDQNGVGVERLVYSYVSVTNHMVVAHGGQAAQLLGSVTLEQADGLGGWRAIRRAVYSYYTGYIGTQNDPHGRLGDLKYATIQNAAGTGGATTWQAIESKYYRYSKLTGEGFFDSWRSGDAYGPTNVSATTGGPYPVHPGNEALDPGNYSADSPAWSDRVVSSGLKTVVEGASLARLAAAHPDYESKPDDDIVDFVDHYFKYERWADHTGVDGTPPSFIWGSDPWNDSDNHDLRVAYRLGTRYRVIEEVAQGSGCTTCSGGQGTYGYEYASSYNPNGLGFHSFEPNIWRMKTTEFLPDGDSFWADNDRNITYTNELGQPMLDVFVDVEDATQVITGFSVVDPGVASTSGKTILVTVPNHGFANGARVAIHGVLPALFNGIYTITRIDANTFSIVLPYNAYGRGYAGDGHGDKAPAPRLDYSSPTVTRVLGEWATFYRYDAEGRLILTAAPSAVGGYNDAYGDLVNYVAGNAEHLKDAAGLISFTSYYTTTTATGTTPGGVGGYVHATFVQQGELGAPIVQQAWSYYARTGGDATIYPVAAVTTFGQDAGTAPDFSDRDPRTTTYSYTWFAGTTLAQSVTVNWPTIASAQHGPGAADAETTVYDLRGRPTWSRDGDGFLHYTAYDDTTGAVVKTIVDVDTTRTGDFAGLPSGWSTPIGGGLHLATSAQVDGLGREVKRIDPSGRVTWTVYLDANHEYRIYRGWDAATHTATGPIEVIREYWPASGSAGSMYGEILTTSAAATYDPVTGAPTGQEVIDAGNIRSLVRFITNSGGQIIETDAYYSLAGLTYAVATPRLGESGNDSASKNYHATVTGYNHRGLHHRTVSPTGTITRTVYDDLGRAISTWVGTNDTGATESNPAGSGGANNMVRVAAYEYDGGGVGDGNLTRLTEYAGASQPRVTGYAYDWRDRLVAMKSGVEVTENTSVNRPIVHYTLNNLGETTAVAQYDGDGIALGTTPPSASLLRAYSEVRYDAQGRAYETRQYSVDQATGAVSTGALSTGTWYDHRGNAIKVSEPGGLVTKWRYDGAGRLVREYTTDGGGDASWADAGTVAGDTVLVQVETAYDAAGNALLVTTRERFHDNAPSATGELGTPASGPRARVSHVAYYYDAADRLTAVVDVGTNGGAAYTRPGTVPGRSDTVLVTSYGYDAAGRVETTTDPRGIVTKALYDLLGRTTRTIAAYDASVNGGNPTTSQNSTTTTTYDGAGHVLTVTAVMPSGTPSQTTRYEYGVVAGAGGSDVTSNDLLAKVYYPGSVLHLGGTATEPAGVDATRGGDWKGTYGGEGAVIVGDVIAMPADASFTVQGASVASWSASTSDPRALQKGAVGSTDRVAAIWYSATSFTIDLGLTDGQWHRLTLYALDWDGYGGGRSQLIELLDGATGNVLATQNVSGFGNGVYLSWDVVGPVMIRVTNSNAGSNAVLSALFLSPAAPRNADTYTYNALGEVTRKTDPGGTTHAYSYDVLGRRIADAVTVLGPGVDGAVRRLETAYDGAGRASLFTSYDAAAGGSVVNQVRHDFNGLGQLVAEYQAHGGGVNTATTPAVRYTYTEMAGGANHSRLSAMTYPNGRIVRSVYNSGLDAAIGRVSALADDAGGSPGTLLETYDYLGLGTIVRRGRPEPGVDLSYIQQPGDIAAIADGGDPYTGLDRFGRVIDQNWVRSSGGSAGTSTDRFQYGYDRAGNRLYKANLIESALSELYRGNSTQPGDSNTAYDPLGRLTGFRRGVLSASGNNGGQLDTVATAYRSQSWSLDALGNWSGVTTDGATTTQTFNEQNQVASTSGALTPAYDHAGNLVADEDGSYIYDAWNRLVGVRSVGTAPVVPDHSFESMWITGYALNPSGFGGWAFDGGSGIADEGSALMSTNGAAPDGDQVGFLSYTGAVIRSVGTWQAGTYRVTLSAAQHGDLLQTYNERKVFEVLIDGVVVGQFDPDSASFEDYTTGAFTVAAGVHTLSIRGVNSVGVALLDNLRIRAATPDVSDFGFETPAVAPNTHVARPTGAGNWVFTGPAGIGTNGSIPMQGTSNAPEGTQAAYLHFNGAVSQSIEGWQAGTYRVIISAAQHGPQLPNKQQIEVLIDGVVVDTITPSDATFRDYTTTTFTVTAGAHTLTLRGTSTASLIVNIDNVRISKVDASRAGYAYDALGRRVIETNTAAGTTDHLYYSPEWQVIEERRDGTDSSDVTRQYVWGVGYVDQMVLRDGYTEGVRADRLYVQQDASYTVSAIVDSGGVVQERYLYDPYGVKSVLTPMWVPRSNNNGDFEWKYLHQGGRLDEATGWYSFRNREYIAVQGRWAQRDLLGITLQEKNIYRLSYNNPGKFVDPWGLLGNMPGDPMVISIGLPREGDLVSNVASIYNKWLCADSIDIDRDNLTWGKYRYDIENMGIGRNQKFREIIFSGHGAPGEFSPFTLGKLRNPNSEESKFLKFLGKKTAKGCKITLKTCYTAGGPEGEELMKLLSEYTNSDVIGYTDQYAGTPHGDEYTTHPDGSREKTDSYPPYKGSKEERKGDIIVGR